MSLFLSLLSTTTILYDLITLSWSFFKDLNVYGNLPCLTCLTLVGSTWCRWGPWCSGRGWSQGEDELGSQSHCSLKSLALSSKTLLADVSLFPQGDRGFDGLPGLPGNKGHKVSYLAECVNGSKEETPVTNPRVCALRGTGVSQAPQVLLESQEKG